MSDDLLTRLDAALVEDDGLLPESDGLTVTEWTKRWGVSSHRAGQLVRKGIENGLMRPVKVRRIRADGRPMTVTVFEEVMRGK